MADEEQKHMKIQPTDEFKVNDAFVSKLHIHSESILLAGLLFGI